MIYILILTSNEWNSSSYDIFACATIQGAPPNLVSNYTTVVHIQFIISEVIIQYRSAH